MALWFHDAVYEPAASDNEQRSAELFAARAGGCFDEGFTRQVCELILATVHATPPRAPDAKLIADIDLSSFGLHWEAFLRDSRAVREEFAHLSDTRFYPAHARFLRSLLARAHLYHTDYFRRQCEANARANIERYLRELAEAGLVDEARGQ